MNTYIFNGQTQTDFTNEYMLTLGMNNEQIESVLNQKAFELSQNLDKRKRAYKAESDPLYMEWQFDQAPESEQAWRNKVAEIKARYPLTDN
ncbi:hypothetical protein TW85_08155 [Marinomonas sp. S3726]|uniref:hypothetical protein n=1 Tax=Marinomonas sp. S3726 TaxID=579484 RepID=UPI0005FA41D2|nr:hypothetical protein [Marinomonas sp. S3726]KJZ14691.1 hypothetical protein TW85_08155 [Marinomonas sp. S3726]